MTGSARLYLVQQGYIRLSKVIYGSARLYWTWVGARDTCVSKKCAQCVCDDDSDDDDDYVEGGYMNLVK